MNRRRLLRTGLGLAALAPLAACTTAPRTLGALDGPAPLVPVRVTPDRVIRRIAGLRPFRPSGFRLETERLGDAHVVHNYGHGGGGWSLSWGCSQLALEEVAAIDGGRGPGKVAVLGSGILGLTSAFLLAREGWDVTVYAKDLPPDTTSNIAGAQWTPVSVHDEDAVTDAYRARFLRASRLAYLRFQSQVGTRYGVRWIDNYYQSEGPEHGGPRGIVRSAPELFPGQRLLGPDEHPFVHPWMWRHSTMLMEPHVYLPELERDLRAMGVAIEIRSFTDRAELAALDAPVIVNCTGLGAGALFGDEEILPIRGQLVFLRPQEAVNYIVIQSRRYMFPRSDGILLGGTFERGEWDPTPTQAATDDILEGHRAFFDAMRAPVD